MHVEKVTLENAENTGWGRPDGDSYSNPGKEKIKAVVLTYKDENYLENLTIQPFLSTSPVQHLHTLSAYMCIQSAVS